MIPAEPKGKTSFILSIFVLTGLLVCTGFIFENIYPSRDTNRTGNRYSGAGGFPTATPGGFPQAQTPAVEPALTLKPAPVQATVPVHPGRRGNGFEAEAVPRTLEELKKTLEKYIAQQSGRYGLYFINLVTGEEFGINDREKYIAASTTKLPMNLLLYKKIAAGEIDFDEKLVYLEEDFEPGSGVIQKSPFGTEYTVRETARLSVVYSDNCAINMIIRLLGIENIRQYMLDIGGTIYYGRDHRSCPYDLAVYARELYRFYQENPEIAGILIEDLQNTMWNDRINKLLPKDVKVAHKIGNYEGVYNDVGIVFAEEPYVLAVMSENADQSVASDVIAQISKKIYDYMVTRNNLKSN
ncbi:class A beta-lactamase-related serine hydrolase [Thermoclostridium stercorarium]|uniref:serine hydrolase n=1 Tax=Thermoclostridium stercorarium TaxID=1510 RepID=UPI002248CB6E|nr:serine hydrolase [Thermoclostridium stercorarium]UZQ86130.1 class A beta-lactamase-related serine hydrolase [Thermoclostridium stercorarium]